MKLTENLHMFTPREAKVVRIIRDGDYVPQPGDILTLRRAGRDAERVEVVRVRDTIRQHNGTLYAFEVRPVKEAHHG